MNEIPELPMPPKSAINEESPEQMRISAYIRINYAQRAVSVPTTIGNVVTNRAWGTIVTIHM